MHRASCRFMPPCGITETLSDVESVRAVHVNIVDSSYVSYAVNNIYGQLQVNQSGDDFYGESFSNIPKIIHKQEQEMLKEFMDKDKVLFWHQALQNTTQRKTPWYQISLTAPIKRCMRISKS